MGRETKQALPEELYSIAPFVTRHMIRCVSVLHKRYLTGTVSGQKQSVVGEYTIFSNQEIIFLVTKQEYEWSLIQQPSSKSQL